jgi:cytochrome P450
MYAPGLMVSLFADRIVKSTPPTQEDDMTTTGPDTDSQNSVAAVCEALGVPRRDWQLSFRWTTEPLTPQALDALYQYVDVMIADRCRVPGDDLLSNLIQTEVDGEELTVDDLRAIVASLVSGAV